MISVILPIFNVERYVEESVTSIMKQTYRDIEIILIDDGSTDLSGKICQGLVEKDNRIRFFQQENKGQGAARNRGIEEAKGEYLLFIDPDDWIDADCIEVLHKRIVECKADFCENKFFFKYDDKKKMLMQDLFRSENSLCCKLIKRDLLIRNNIRMPELFFEDAAMWPLVFVMSKKTVTVEKPLYYYRKNTGSSTLDNSERIKDIPDAMAFMACEAMRLRIYDKNKDFFLDEAKKHLDACLNRCNRELGIDEFRKLYDKVQTVIVGFFPGWFEKFKVERFWIWGSYNLSRVVAYLSQDYYNLMSKDLFCFFGFSSVISLMSDKWVLLNGNEHCNTFRQDVLNKDITKVFRDIDVNGDDYLILDFLEERYDILEYNGNYITKSDALVESRLDIAEYRVIKRLSTECTKLWEKKCLKFIELIKTKFLSKQIIVLELYLTPKAVINGQDKYYSSYKIDMINRVLRYYYDFFKKNFAGIRFVCVPSQLNYTDGGSVYGTGAEYLNFNAHKHLAQLIRNRITQKKTDDKVSVIMPAYKGERFIGEAIESILNQTYDDFELIIIDDCSPDSTMEIVEQYHDDRIRIIHNERNLGIAHSRNVGLANSTGKYIAIMDDDDVALPERLEKEVMFLKQNLDIDMVGGRYDVINENGDLIYHETFSLHNPKYIRSVLLFRNIYGSSTVLMKKEIVEKYNLKFKDNQLGMEDYRFWMEYSKVGNLSTIDDVILLYRKSSHNESHRVLDSLAEERKKIFAKLQRDSIQLSGFQLEEQYLAVLNKVVAEFGGKCESKNEIDLFFEALKKIVHQAKEKGFDYCEELEIYLKKVYVEGLQRTSTDVFWKQERN